MIQQRLWFAFAVIAGVSFAVQVMLPIDLSDRPETTFDTAPRGHAGVFALLDRFGATPGRWLSRVTLPPITDTIWWIAPGGACQVGAPKKPTADDSESATVLSSPFELTLRPWIEAGGTALIWLSHPPLETLALEILDSPAENAPSTDASRREGDGAIANDEESPAEDEDESDVPGTRKRWQESLTTSRRHIRDGKAARCGAILGVRLPNRQLAGLEGGAPPEEGRYSPVVFSVGRATARRQDFDYARTRVLPGPTLGFFDLERRAKPGEPGEPGEIEEQNEDGRARDLAEWRALWVEADDGTPLALERSMGEGRLIVIADARILSNDRLGHVDSAPFVFDWVADYGPPWIDEHSHGIVPEAGTFRYLARSPAWAAGVGLLVLGVLVAWRGHAWPTRRVSEYDPEAPSLAAFVDSLARLYSGTRDHARVFDRYRAICLDRIRRALGLSPGTSVEIILASLRTRAPNWPELEEAGLRHLLTREIPIPAATDLARNAARLDALVRVLRDAGNRANRDRRGPPESGTATGDEKGRM